MNECTLKLALKDHPLEFSAASDLLYENGFYDASAALRILYPKLPQSMLNKAYIFRELTKEGVEHRHIDRFKLRLTVDALYGATLLEEHYDCNVDRIDFIEELETDSKSLIIKFVSVFSDITGVFHLKTINLIVDNVVLSPKLVNDSQSVMPGDSINLTYTMQMPDYLLPSEVVSNFKPDYSIRRVGA